MLTKLKIKNLKQFEDIEIELGKAVVLIGPNNSGKTTALQALALWEIGLKRWNEKRKGKISPEKRSAVVINRNDLISIPVPNAKLLWKDLKVRNFKGFKGKEKRKPQTENVRIVVVVEGITFGKKWTCGLEFDYANEESLYCRPLRLEDNKNPKRMQVPDEAAEYKVAFLPPMSGLAAIEPKSEPGRISVLIGEGQTAQVLRNLCYQIYEESTKIDFLAHSATERIMRGSKEITKWDELIENINNLFGVKILPPKYIKERGEITMEYKDISGIQLDISSSGRGLQQTLLLLAYLYSNPKTILLLDEPDAHLEILRQRQIYKLLTEIAEKQDSQIVAASHSEVVLNEAAERDMVIAFVGKPHRIDDRGSQVLKALKDIGFDQYYMAEQNGWVLYTEGSTDLAILQSFAKTLNHNVLKYLERPFIHYTGNKPTNALTHFHGLREALPNLKGIAIYDRLEKKLQDDPYLIQMMWSKREIENYLCQEGVLLSYARHNLPFDLFHQSEGEKREKAMNKSINEISDALKVLRKIDPWSSNIKATDDFLNPLFEKYFEKLRSENLLRKSGYYLLADLVPKEKIDSEIVEKLDAILKIAKKAKSNIL